MVLLSWLYPIFYNSLINTGTIRYTLYSSSSSLGASPDPYYIDIPPLSKESYYMPFPSHQKDPSHPIHLIRRRQISNSIIHLPPPISPIQSYSTTNISIPAFISHTSTLTSWPAIMIQARSWNPPENVSICFPILREQTQQCWNMIYPMLRYQIAKWKRIEDEVNLNSASAKSFSPSNSWFIARICTGIGWLLLNYDQWGLLKPEYITRSQNHSLSAMMFPMIFLSKHLSFR